VLVRPLGFPEVPEEIYELADGYERWNIEGIGLRSGPLRCCTLSQTIRTATATPTMIRAISPRVHSYYRVVSAAGCREQIKTGAWASITISIGEEGIVEEQAGSVNNVFYEHIERHSARHGDNQCQ
jgi:hypothetical protein